MSEPMSAGEIEDVLSSIRRLVSEELRPMTRAPRTEPDGKLMLTPALRIVVADPVVEPAQMAAPDPVTRDLPPQWVADSDEESDVTQIEGFVFQGRRAAANSHAAEDVASESVEAESLASDSHPAEGHASDRHVSENHASDFRASESLSSEGLSSESHASESHSDDLPDTIAWASEPETPVIYGEILPAQEETILAPAAWAQEAPMEDPATDLGPDAGPDPVADSDSTGDEADATDPEWFRQAEAEVMAALSAQSADLGAGDESDTAREGVTPDASVFAQDMLFDETVLRDLVRDLIREELQGSLGERITRNVRKLVRVEVARALSLHDLE